MFPVDKVGPVACESFLVGVTCVCVLVDGAGSRLSGGQCSVCSEFWGVCELCLTLDCLSFNVQVCVLF